MPDLRTPLTTSLQAFAEKPLRESATALLGTLGYQSDKTIALDDSSPQAFLDLLQQSAPDSTFNQEKALFADWTSADLLFQFTDEELNPTATLFSESEVKPSLLRSYLFFAIQLNGDSAVNGSYARGKLTAIARQLNRVFPMPVMVLIQHPQEKKTVLSIAVINRRQNKANTHKDVLGKVTIIRDISLTEPHRGHLDILNSFALPNLVHPDKKKIINDFDTLHAAWEEIFNIELLNKRFYQELANWYFWALPQVQFPADLEPDDEKRRATGLIRLLTRLVFCWFIKEKDLIPEKLFHTSDLADILKDFDPRSETDSTYYQAILQNLFFATLNQRMGKPKEKGAKPYRQFALDEGFQKNRATHDLNNFYRYEGHFQGTPEEALSHFADVPFLNGGLFECLDRRDEDKKKSYYLDGFSRNASKRPHVPNHLFFSDELKGIDLSETYGDKKRKKETVSGLINILNRYKFTIVENTPIDQEIALDPELLGKVFENLLASYNEETKTTARKQTGSFYTPRPIVDYMVDESLKAHLAQALADQTPMSRLDAEAGLDILFAYTERDHAFSDPEIDILLDAIHTCKILDPACGSGAFPMGILHKLVYIIHKLDPANDKWKQRQIDAASAIPDSSAREAAIAAIEDAFDNNEDDYGRKLYLIENCLYGVDIQPIAIQISKLRFFISLVCDQKTNRDKNKNHGIRPLPNLETKFVAADTLIGLPEMDESVLIDPRVGKIERQIESLYHRHFSIQRRDQKLSIQSKIKDLRQQLGDILSESLMAPAKARHVANWDPFDPQASSDFFDPFWMFGIFAGTKTKKDAASLTGNFSAIADDELVATEVENDGFDIVIGNPPYVQIQKFSAKQKATWQQQKFKTYAATADIYCLFYERGAQLLRDGGSLVYITSNKWMRAGYGKSLREFFKTQVSVDELLDFWGILVFQAATVDTCIVRFSLSNPSTNFPSTALPRTFDFRTTLENYVAEHSSLFRPPESSVENWAVISKERQQIKETVELLGTALGEWDIRINYGIKTGYNDAFYIPQKKRNKLIELDPNCDQLIKPLLRGRFVDRYGTDWDQTWMISTFPALGLEENRLPLPIKNHLENYLPKLNQTGGIFINQEGKREKTRKKTDHHWFETQDSISYHEDFHRPKIVYPNMTKFLPFYYDGAGEFCSNDKSFIINSETESLPYLTAVFNSTLFRCCFKDNFPTQGEDRRELRGIFFKLLRIKKPLTKESKSFDALIPLVQFAKARDSSAYRLLEDLIDACVMECYFQEHMAERDLLFLDQLAPTLAGYDPNASDSDQHSFLEQLLRIHNAPTAKVRNQLLRLTADSPDLLAVIKKEGRV